MKGETFCRILGFHSGTVRDSGVLGYYVISTGTDLPMFHLQVWKSKHFFGLLILEQEGTTILRNVSNYLPVDTV